MNSEEGWTPNPVVFINDSERSQVLDKNGDPYTLSKKVTVGFNLKKKGNK